MYADMLRDANKKLPYFVVSASNRGDLWAAIR